LDSDDVTGLFYTGLGIGFLGFGMKAMSGMFKGLGKMTPKK
jgi:hypothetical protein